MASETISASANWNALTSTKAYGETVTIQGGAVLTLDESVDAQGIADAAIGVNITCIAGFSRFEILNDSDDIAIQYAGQETGTLRVEAGSEFRVRGKKIFLKVSGSPWESDGTENQSIAGSAWTDLYAAANEPAVIFVETGDGTNVYEPWLNAGGLALSTFGAAQLGKWFSFNTSTGAISFGDGGDAAANRGGAIPPNGARVMVFNVGIGKVNSSAVWGIHATIGSNFEFDTSPGGVVDLEECYLFGFYANAQTATRVRLANVGTIPRFNLQDCKAVELVDGFAGINRYAADLGLYIRSPESLDMTGGAFASENAANAGNFEYCKGALIDGPAFIMANRNSANDLPLQIYRSPGFQMTNVKVIGGRISVSESPNVKMKDLVHSDSPRGVAFGSLYGTTIDVSAASSEGCELDGLTLHPEGVAAAHTINFLSAISVVKNVNYPQASAYIYAGIFGSFFHNNNFGAPTSRFSNHNSSDVDCVIQNSHCDSIPQFFNNSTVPSRSIFKGCDNSAIPTNLAGTAGTHFYEFRKQISPELGFMGIFFTPKSDGSSAYSVVAGSIAFDLNGSIYLLTSDAEIIYTWPHRVMGVVDFPSAGTLTKAGTNPNNFTIEYDIDLGAGFSGSWTTLSMANLAGHTIDPDIGFGFKVRITRGSASATDRLNQLTWDTETDYATYKYPEKLVSVTLKNVVTGSTYAVYRGTPSVANQIALGTAAGGDIVIAGVAYLGDEQINVRVRKSSTSSDPDYLEFNGAATLTALGAEVFVNQVEDLVA